MTDPIAALAAVVKSAQERVELGHLVNMVRRIDETDRETIRRLIDERSHIVELFRDNGIQHDSFDHTYKENFFTALEHLKKKLNK